MVALLGLLGGGLSAAVSIRHLHGSSTPYDVPVALSLLKLPSGALSAVIGLVFIRGEFVPGLSQLDNQPQILAYAFLFGIAQQLVTRLVDRQAQDVLTKVPSKEPTTANPSHRWSSTTRRRKASPNNHDGSVGGPNGRLANTSTDDPRELLHAIYGPAAPSRPITAVEL